MAAVTVSVEELAARFEKLLEQVEESGQPVFILRAGVPAAVLLSMGEYERLTQVQRAITEGDFATAHVLSGPTDSPSATPSPA